MALFGVVAHVVVLVDRTLSEEVPELITNAYDLVWPARLNDHDPARLDGAIDVVTVQAPDPDPALSCHTDKNILNG